MKVAYAYGRASMWSQICDGNEKDSPKADYKTLEAQEEDCQAAFRERYAKEFTYGGFFREEAEHGDTPFYQRPVAAVLAQRLKQGDVIIVTSVDRAFRNFADCFLCLADWHNRGIILYPIEFGIDTSTDAGLMVVQIRAAVAQYELSLIRKRTKRILKKRKEMHGFTNQFPGYGWKLVGPPGKRRRVPDVKERAQLRAIVRMHDRLGLSLEAIYLRFAKRRKRTRQGKLWSYDRIKRAYQAAKELGIGKNGSTAPPSPAPDGTPAG